MLQENVNTSSNLLEINLNSENLHTLSDDSSYREQQEEEYKNNQITEYKEELVIIETEIIILNNIIFNMVVCNKKSIINLNHVRSNIFNKNNCDTLMFQIKKLAERKIIIENAMCNL